MSVIFPGNYVANLNAYRDQGVFALPGVEFYQARGAAIVTSDLIGGGSLAVEVLSPDLRQDDKPRLDKPLTIPAGAKVYRTAISVQNLASTGTDTVKVDGLTTAGLEATLAASGGEFPEAGAIGPSTGFDFGTTQSSESSGATITAAYSGALSIVDKDSTAAVLVEVCYYLDADGPDADDYSLPYKTEAGQGY